MKITINGATTELTQNHFKFKGGEGSVYVKGSTAFKIYEPDKMMPQAKARELSVLNDPHIIIPISLIKNVKGKGIGYTMPFVNNAHELCKLFTKTFKQDNNITDDKTIHLVQRLQRIVESVHSKSILIVDLNEFNFLMDEHLKEIYAIDTNSYQTPSFPATVILPAIQDVHSKEFSCETDWYSWGILVCQMLVGIHPYKGNHPAYKKVPKANRMRERKLNNISIFNKEVTVPSICPPLDIIPKGLKQWMVEVFERGLRIPPPANIGKVVPIAAEKIKVITGKLISYKEIEYKPDELVYNKNNVPFAIDIQKNCAIITNCRTGRERVLDGQVSEYFKYDGRLYLCAENYILEVVFLGDKPATQLVQSTLLSRQILDGCIIQNMLGAYYLSVFSGNKEFKMFPLQELNGYKIVSGKLEQEVFICIAAKGGQYHRFIYDLKTGYSRVTQNIDYLELNCTTLPNRLSLLITEDSKMEVFKGPHTKVLEDESIRTDMKLLNDGLHPLVSHNNKMYKINFGVQ
jgi:serine/threonine protein kinase